MASVVLVECLPPWGAVEDVLGCVGSLRAIAKAEQTETSMAKLKRKNNRTAAGKLFGVILFESILSLGHVVWADTAVHLLTTELP